MRNVVLALLLAVVLPGCGEKKSEEKGFLENAQASATDSATHPASPGGAAVVPTTSGGSTVLVALEDGRIVIQDADKIPPGPAVLTISNTGKETHNLFIEGEGLNKAAGDNIAPGTDAAMDVTFKPGNYTMYCPVLDHRAKGESILLVIRPSTAPAPTSTAIPGTVRSTGTAAATST